MRVERLGYRLEAWHVALIATGAGAEGALAKLSQAPGTLSCAPRPILRRRGRGSALRPPRHTSAELEALLLRSAALSIPHGRSGRAQPRSARLALWPRAGPRGPAGRALPPGEPAIVRYGEVVLISPWLRDPAARPRADRAVPGAALSAARRRQRRTPPTLAASLPRRAQPHRRSAPARRRPAHRLLPAAQRSRTPRPVPGQPRRRGVEVALRVHELLHPRT